MKLSITPISQRDSRWGSQRLGTVDATTIGSHGCVITSMAMLSTYYNHPILPNEIDDILTDRNLYYDGNLFVNGSITKIFPDIVFDNVLFCESTPAPIDKIKAYLDNGKPCVVALINFGIRHYVLVVGYEGNNIYVNDPWQGDQVAINDRWGDPAVKILQINFFSGPVPQITSPQPPPLIPQIPVVDHTSEDNLKIKISTLELNNQSLQIQLNTANAQINDLNNKIVSLNATIASHPNDGAHMGDGIVPVPVAVDMAPIKETLDTGLSNISDTVDKLLKNPITAIPVKRLPLFLNSLLSRKFLLAVISAAVTFLNSTLNLGITNDQLMIFILPVIAYILGQGIVDSIIEWRKRSI